MRFWKFRNLWYNNSLICSHRGTPSSSYSFPLQMPHCSSWSTIAFHHYSFLCIYQCIRVNPLLFAYYNWYEILLHFVRLVASVVNRRMVTRSKIIPLIPISNKIIKKTSHKNHTNPLNNLLVAISIIRPHKISPKKVSDWAHYSKIKLKDLLFPLSIFYEVLDLYRSLLKINLSYHINQESCWNLSLRSWSDCMRLRQAEESDSNFCSALRYSTAYCTTRSVCFARNFSIFAFVGRLRSSQPRQLRKCFSWNRKLLIVSSSHSPKHSFTRALVFIISWHF